MIDLHTTYLMAVVLAVPLLHQFQLKMQVPELEKRRLIRHFSNLATMQNISNKLTRGTIKYSEIKEIANIIGFRISWAKDGETT